MSTMQTIVTEMANIGPKMSGKFKGYDDMEKIVDEDDRPEKAGSAFPLANLPAYLTETVKSLRRGTLALLMIIVCLGILSVALTIAFVISANRRPVTLTEVAPFGCASSHCMKRASEVEEALDRSTSPCDDFHEYACGGWHAWGGMPPGEDQITVKLAIDAEIREKLTGYLESPVERNFTDSAERKIKLLFKSCLNDYEKTRQGSNPLLKIIEESVNNWFVFDDNLDNWHIQSTVERVQSDYRVEALFKVEVANDDDYPGKKSITIRPSGLTMSSTWYTSSWSRAEKVREDFKKFMRSVAILLVRDSKITMTEDLKNSRIETFVNDVFTFETDLANITSRTRNNPQNPFDDEERVTLPTLNSQTNNVINWLGFFQYMFLEAGITSNTKVVIHKKQYILQMASYINNLGANSTRILNNYFVWRLAYSYLQDLSWEYVHANREFYVDRTGRAEFLGTWRYCFNYVSSKMDVALSHLFIQDHFADDNKQKVHEIADYVKQSLLDHLTDFKWLDDKTRAYARNKVQGIVDKLGYPDFIMDPNRVDEIYLALEINETDYFQNVLNLNKFDRIDWTNQLKKGEDRSKWFGNTYSSFAQYYFPWNELLVPAGILQWPIYDYHIPHYLNFGSMGSVIAQGYLHSIDYRGSFYQVNGSRSDTRWWSSSVDSKYNTSKNCFVDYFANKTLGPYTIFGRKITIPVRTKSTSFAGDAALEVGGLKQAYYGYKKWEADHNGEPRAPGLGLSNEQMFFIAYAQTWCFVRTDISAYIRAGFGNIIPENLKVNAAVSQMKEFNQAFKCPANSPMNPVKKCSIW